VTANFTFGTCDDAFLPLPRSTVVLADTIMQQEKQNAFAYGFDHVDGQPCPAVAAGYEPYTIDKSTKVVEWYDDILAEKLSNEVGIVSEETAQEAWNEALTRLEELGESEPIRVGTKIANELGWL